MISVDIPLPLWYNYYRKTLVFGSGTLNTSITTEHKGFITSTQHETPRRTDCPTIVQVFVGFCVVKGDIMELLDENYYTIKGFMLNRLHLKGIALNVYAIIYGFSQDGCTEYHGGRKYLCDFTGASKPTIDRALEELTDSGYIIKRKETINGVTFNRYRANLEIISNFTTGKELINRYPQNDNPGGNKMMTNRKEDKEDVFIYPPTGAREEIFGTETGQCPNPQEYFFEHWNVTTDDLTGREAGALSYMDFEKLNAAMEKSKSFLQTDKIARYITFYIRNYKRIIAGYYDDDKHNPSKSTSKSKNAAEPPRERYDMKAICAEDRSGGVF